VKQLYPAIEAISPGLYAAGTDNRSTYRTQRPILVCDRFLGADDHATDQWAATWWPQTDRAVTAGVGADPALATQLTETGYRQAPRATWWKDENLPISYHITVGAGADVRPVIAFKGIAGGQQETVLARGYWRALLAGIQTLPDGRTPAQAILDLMGLAPVQYDGSGGREYPLIPFSFRCRMDEVVAGVAAAQQSFEISIPITVFEVTADHGRRDVLELCLAHPYGS